MVISIKFGSSSKLGHVGSKTISFGQIIEKPCVHSRGHSFDPKFMLLCQTDNLIKSTPGLKLDHVAS